MLPGHQGRGAQCPMHVGPQTLQVPALKALKTLSWAQIQHRSRRSLRLQLPWAWPLGEDTGQAPRPSVGVSHWLSEGTTTLAFLPAHEFVFFPGRTLFQREANECSI